MTSVRSSGQAPPLTDAEAMTVRREIERDAAALLAENPTVDDARAVTLAERVRLAMDRIGRRRWEAQTRELYPWTAP